MFSGIRDLLRITPAARDTQHQSVQQKRDEAGGGQRQAAREAFADDDTMFSIAAIRALLTTEPLPDDIAAVLTDDEKQKILAGLASLEAQGIHNIPLRLNQSILDAVRASLP